jgi:hypothetical protein
MQFQQIDGFDTKAAALLGFCGVVLALLFGSGTVLGHWNAAFTVASVAFSSAAIAAGFALFPRGFKYNPSVAALNRWAAKYQPGTTAMLTSRSIQAAMTYNRKGVQHKLRGLQVAAGLIIAGVVALGVGLIVSPHEAANQTGGAERPTIERERR